MLAKSSGPIARLGQVELFIIIRLSGYKYAERLGWYDIHVFKGQSPDTPVTYTAQYKALCVVHKRLGIQTTVKTQYGRKLGAGAESAGASAASVDKQGHWSTKSRNGAYAHNNIPWEAVRVLAGFGPEPKKYYLLRALLVTYLLLLIL